MMTSQVIKVDNASCPMRANFADLTKKAPVAPKYFDPFDSPGYASYSQRNLFPDPSHLSANSVLQTVDDLGSFVQSCKVKLSTHVWHPVTEIEDVHIFYIT